MSITGLIGKKIGMASIFNEDGKNIPCTILEMGPCYVTQIKNEEKDGYEAIQIGFDKKKENRTTNSLKGHFKKANTENLKKLVEFGYFDKEVKLGEVLKVNDVFTEGEYVDVVGQSKGKGFQGVVKRHGFSGVGQATHGQHNRLRAPGSIGAGSDPSRVFKGMRMAGRTGGTRVTVSNSQIVKILEDKNVILVKGAVPGYNGNYIILEK